MSNGVKAVLGIGILAVVAVAVQVATGPARLSQFDVATTARALNVYYGYAWFVLLYSIAMPFVPWVFARGQGGKRVWGSAGIAFLSLVVVHALLWPVCVVTSCGGHAMLMAATWMLVPIAAVATAISAAVAPPPL